MEHNGKLNMIDLHKQIDHYIIVFSLGVNLFRNNSNKKKCTHTSIRRFRVTRQINCLGPPPL